MNKIIVIYGSTTGTTEDVAGRIAAKLNTSAIPVSDLSQDVINDNDVLILGSSTWGAGELQDDWYDGVETLKTANLNGKKIAIFGCGDSSSYSDTFCDAISIIYNAVAKSDATLVGRVSKDGYSFDSSASLDGDEFLGLPIDEMNESHKTDERIDAWLKSLNL